jgi:hypothetical protein
MADVERKAGLTFSAYFAVAIKEYARRYGLPIDRLQELFVTITVKSHYPGSFNKISLTQSSQGLESWACPLMNCYIATE